MVSMDTCIGLILWFPEVPCAVKDAKERVEYLLEDLDRRKEKILIPAPALAEILVHAGAGGPPFLATILKSSRFQIGDRRRSKLLWFSFSSHRKGKSPRRGFSSIHARLRA